MILLSVGGTVALMAELNGRNYLGSEINPNYCKIAKERFEMNLFTQT